MEYQTAEFMSILISEDRDGDNKNNHVDGDIQNIILLMLKLMVKNIDEYLR